MNDFIILIISVLHRSLAQAIAVLILCVLVLGASYFVFQAKYKGEHRFPWLKTILALLLIGYVTVLLSITVFRGEGGYGNVNLHLFRAWREAWNSFSLKNWLNVLLNAAMFLPLGILLPLLIRCFRKWYFMLAAGFGVSLAIEGIQYISCSGTFDVDDLFANTLGAMLGFCIVMVFVSALTKDKNQRKRSIIYAILPIAAIAALSGTLITYYAQEYGNLQDAAAFAVNTKGITWDLQCTLNDSVESVPVYQTEPFDKESCDAFGAAFFEMIGAVYNDVSYYDNTTYFMNHASPAHFLIVSHLDRSYEYSYGGQDDDWAEKDEATLREMLLAYDIQIPESAEFTYEGDGWHQFSVDRVIDGATMIDGTVRCRYTANGTLRKIQNNMVSYAFYKNEDIISQTEAYELLCNGNISGGGTFEYYSPEKITVLSCTLEYCIDTKGFYQPIYVFELFVSDADHTFQAIIPALQ